MGAVVKHAGHLRIAIADFSLETAGGSRILFAAGEPTGK
jgi:hypothetical protein